MVEALKLTDQDDGDRRRGIHPLEATSMTSGRAAAALAWAEVGKVLREEDDIEKARARELGIETTVFDRSIHTLWEVIYAARDLYIKSKSKVIRKSNQKLADRPKLKPRNNKPQ